MTGSELPIKKNKFPQLLHNWRWNMPGFHLQDETCWKGVGRWRKGSTAEVFMPVFTGNCVIAKQPNHVYPAQSFHTLNNRHFSPHQSTPDPCICYVNSIELEQESSCSVPPLFPPKRLHRTALLHNTESRFYLFIYFLKSLISDYNFTHFKDYVQVMLHKSQDYKRLDNFPTIPDLQMTISAVGLCHFHVAENKTALPRHRGTFRTEWKAAPDGIISFPQATTHQLSLLRPWVLDKNNFIRTRTVKNWSWVCVLILWRDLFRHS